MNKMIASVFLLSLTAASPLLANDADGPPPSEKIKEGLENVKEGTKEVAKDVGAAAEKVGQTAAETGKKVGRSLKAATCPIVGDRKSKFYYAADSKSYESVLDGQKYFEDDDRECFMTEKAARDGGYTRSAN